MKLSIERDTLLGPLQAIQGVVERRHTLPVLANVLLSVQEGTLACTATDMEVELVATTDVGEAEPGEITVPARKLIDICRSLPEGAAVSVEVDGERAVLRSGRSRFTLATLPAADYPATEEIADSASLKVPEGKLKRLLGLTHYAMAHQDVRYYLNGLLLEIGGGELRAVATDGHRLAISGVSVDCGEFSEPRQLILPRKGVVELMRLLGEGESDVALEIGSGAVRVAAGGLRLTSKLIDGRFPDYERVIPDRDGAEKVIEVDRTIVSQALGRAAILSNDKYRAVRLCLETNLLRVEANNPEQERAEDEVEVEYEGESLEIGFNVSYLIEALNALPGERARLFLSDPSSSCLIEPEGEDDCRFVVMPMRL